MADPVDQIAEKLIAAAYAIWGKPGEAAGGDYTASVTGHVDVPAHFRRIAKLAATPRSMDLYEQYREATAHYDDDRDADMVMHAGLDHLLKDTAGPPTGARARRDGAMPWPSWSSCKANTGTGSIPCR